MLAMEGDLVNYSPTVQGRRNKPPPSDWESGLRRSCAEPNALIHIAYYIGGEFNFF